VSIYGIDPSLASTGLAYISDWYTPVTSVIRTKGKRADGLVERDGRIMHLRAAVLGWKPNGESARSAKLIVIEGPSHGSRGGSPWDRAGLWWNIVHDVSADRVAVVPPPTRAKWATGNGRADKAAVAVVAARLCPDAELPSSDAADALVLALMGAHALGLRPDLETKYRHEALLASKWPTDIAARLLEPYERPVEDEVIV
jgi:Holliday junction resolvasome RuvABC endonuclease subunit